VLSKEITAQSSSISAGSGTISGSQRDPCASTVVSPGPPAGKVLAGRPRRQFIFAIVCLAAIAGVGVGLWFFLIRDRFVPKRLGVVVAGEIYRSGQISRYLIADVIDRYQIGTIVDLNGFDPNDADQQAEASVSRLKGVRHYCFPLRGNGTGKIVNYADAIETIVSAQQSRIPVLVHCYAGTQRTGACVSFYRLLILKDQPESVYEELGRYGWDAGSNQVLIEYVNSHLRELAQLLVQRHVLDRVPDAVPSLHP
jgi:hypothetical protein